jgi:hypothetical protein
MSFTVRLWELKEDVIEAVHEEAQRAFEAGERERAQTQYGSLYRVPQTEAPFRHPDETP